MKTENVCYCFLRIILLWNIGKVRKLYFIIFLSYSYNYSSITEYLHGPSKSLIKSNNGIKKKKSLVI